MQSILRQALQLHLRRAGFRILLPSRYIDVRDQAEHPYDIRAGDDEAFLGTVEKMTRDRVLHSRCGMSILAYGIHDEVLLIICYELSQGEHVFPEKRERLNF